MNQYLNQRTTTILHHYDRNKKKEYNWHLIQLDTIKCLLNEQQNKFRNIEHRWKEIKFVLRETKTNKYQRQCFISPWEFFITIESRIWMKWIKILSFGRYLVLKQKNRHLVEHFVVKYSFVCTAVIANRNFVYQLRETWKSCCIHHKNIF